MLYLHISHVIKRCDNAFMIKELIGIKLTDLLTELICYELLVLNAFLYMSW